MKKLISILVLVSVLAGCFCITSAAEYTAYTPGDVNGDGCVDLKDVTALTSSNTYGKTFSDAETKSADINGDRCFDLKDLTIITSDKHYGKAPARVEY